MHSFQGSLTGTAEEFLFEFLQPRIDNFKDRKVTVHDRIKQCVEQEADAVLSQLRTADLKAATDRIE